VPGTGTKTVTLKLTAGAYKFYCPVHESTMFGHFIGECDPTSDGSDPLMQENLLAYVKAPTAFNSGNPADLVRSARALRLEPRHTSIDQDRRHRRRLSPNLVHRREESALRFPRRALTLPRRRRQTARDRHTPLRSVRANL
jgi:hypothetical protein